MPVDTSFFCTNQFSEDIIEKNLRQAISLASSKADACRRIMALEPLGYVTLSNMTEKRRMSAKQPHREKDQGGDTKAMNDPG